MNVAPFDPIIHAPKRLVAMATLASSEWAEFAYLRQRLAVSDSDLSKQMKILQDAGYVKVSKRGKGRGGSTWYRLTSEGRRAFDAHVELLLALVTAGSVTPDGPEAPVVSATPPVAP